MTGRGKKDWQEETLGPAVKRFPERKEEFVTSSGIVQEAIYTPEDVGDADYQRDLIVSLWRLGTSDPDNAESHLTRAMGLLKDMESKGILAPSDEGMIPALQEALNQLGSQE